MTKRFAVFFVALALFALAPLLDRPKTEASAKPALARKN